MRSCCAMLEKRAFEGCHAGYAIIISQFFTPSSKWNKFPSLMHHIKYTVMSSKEICFLVIHSTLPRNLLSYSDNIAFKLYSHYRFLVFLWTLNIKYYFIHVPHLLPVMVWSSISAIKSFSINSSSWVSMKHFPANEEMGDSSIRLPAFGYWFIKYHPL